MRVSIHLFLNIHGTEFTHTVTAVSGPGLEIM